MTDGINENRVMQDVLDAYANPSIEEVLLAVPMLQWRKCHDCNHVGLYRDNILPACKCRVCSSADTRHVLKANQALHRTL